MLTRLIYLKGVESLVLLQFMITFGFAYVFCKALWISDKKNKNGIVLMRINPKAVKITSYGATKKYEDNDANITTRVELHRLGPLYKTLNHFFNHYFVVN